MLLEPAGSYDYGTYGSDHSLNYPILVVPLSTITLVILQEFFRRLEQLSGYDVINLSNIWSLEDVIFVEVRKKLFTTS